MWSDSDGEKELTPNEVGGGRTSSASDVVVLEERMASQVPNIAQLNVSHKSKVHMGPKFVSVTQNVNNAEMIKTRFLGLEMISARNTLRCSITVFICWALVVAVGLAVYFFRYTLPKTQTRLDLDVALPCYLWQLAKSTSRAERLCCLAALAGVAACLALVVYYSRAGGEPEDKAPHEWNITREMWRAQKYVTRTSTEPFEPLRLVVVQHSVSQECHRFAACAAELHILQDMNIRNCPCDIAYNFVIGNEGRVYEGRGWGRAGAHTAPYNNCSLGIGFIGDYREEIVAHARVTELQMNRTMRLLDYGVAHGYLHPDYYIIGAKDISATASPGSNLYNALKKLKHFHNGVGIRDRSCVQVYADFEKTARGSDATTINDLEHTSVNAQHKT